MQADPQLESGLFVLADLSRTSLGQHSRENYFSLELKSFLKQSADCPGEIGRKICELIWIKID